MYSVAGSSFVRFAVLFATVVFVAGRGRRYDATADVDRVPPRNGSCASGGSSSEETLSSIDRATPAVLVIKPFLSSARII